MKHIHDSSCVLQDTLGPVYTPCRVDGLDRNLHHMNRADFETRVRMQDFRGLTLVCQNRTCGSGATTT